VCVLSVPACDEPTPYSDVCLLTFVHHHRVVVLFISFCLGDKVCGNPLQFVFSLLALSSPQLLREPEPWKIFIRLISGNQTLVLPNLPTA
jgi:hypothetical protein